MTDPASDAAIDPVPSPARHAARTSFAHASEAELARILDFYDVHWTYEPDTFPIGWSLDGEVVESFSPDFYLPDLDLYVELTTLKQKLVRKKNRKLRRLRELYPDVRIKLFYARDFRMLLLKFGRLALVDELTGTMGQATPPRADGARRDPAIEGEAMDGAVTARPEVAPSDAPAGSGTGTAGAATGPVPVPASSPELTFAHDPGSTPRGRRRGRRRRRAAGQGATVPAIAGRHDDPEPPDA